MKPDYDKLPPECDELCQWRSCLSKGENKGAYTQGRGYTSYYREPEYVCMTRMLHGCPCINNHRPLPVNKEVLDQLYSVVREAKATHKVKNEMYKMLKIIQLLFSIIENETAYLKAKEKCV